MHVLDALNEWRADRDHVSSIEVAKAMFKAQMEGISQISETRGFREIVLYWKRVQESAHARLVSAEGRGAEIARGEAKCAGDFLAFLTNLVSASQAQEKINSLAKPPQ